jgi:hypothetical protein
MIGGLRFSSWLMAFWWSNSPFLTINQIWNIYPSIDIYIHWIPIYWWHPSVSHVTNRQIMGTARPTCRMRWWKTSTPIGAPCWDMWIHSSIFWRPKYLGR